MKGLPILVFATILAVSDDGAGLDPHGGTGKRPAAQDIGCGIDPNGCGDEGVGIDPFGRPAAADSDYSACLDPNGRCRG